MRNNLTLLIGDKQIQNECKRLGVILIPSGEYTFDIFAENKNNAAEMERIIERRMLELVMERN